MVLLLRGSEVIGTKSFKYNPKDIVEWKSFEYNAEDVAFADEPVKVFGRGNFDDFPGETFYLVIQGGAPQLHFGVLEEFMHHRYPQTMASLDSTSLLQIGLAREFSPFLPIFLADFFPIFSHFFLADFFLHFFRFFGRFKIKKKNSFFFRKLMVERTKRW